MARLQQYVSALCKRTTGVNVYRRAGKFDVLFSNADVKGNAE